MNHLLRRLAFILILFLHVYQVAGQGFWMLTEEFPGGPKTGITLVQDILYLEFHIDA